MGMQYGPPGVIVNCTASSECVTCWTLYLKHYIRLSKEMNIEPPTFSYHMLGCTRRCIYCIPLHKHITQKHPQLSLFCSAVWNKYLVIVHHNLIIIIIIIELRHVLSVSLPRSLFVCLFSWNFLFFIILFVKDIIYQGNKKH